MSIRNFLEALASGDNIAAKEFLNLAMSEKAVEQLDQRKQEIAQSVFDSGKQTNEQVDLSDFTLEEIEDFMMSEEFEQLDELSKKTLGSYVSKAATNLSQSAWDAAKDTRGSFADPMGPDIAPKDDPFRKMAARKAGLKRVGKRLAKEQFEQLDEISKKTLGNYVKAAANDVAAKAAATRQFSNDAQAAKNREDFTAQRRNNDAADRVFAKSWKRRQNMGKAIDRLTKEDADK